MMSSSPKKRPITALNNPSASLNSSRFEAFFWWTLALLWAALIFGASTGAFSASLTARILTHLFQVLHVHVSPETFDRVHFLVRKGAHMTEYAIFALLLYRAFRPEHRFCWSGRTALYVVLVAGIYSLTDEFHQSFVPNRTSSLVDCGIDTMGALIGLSFNYTLHRLIYTARNNREAMAAVAAEK